ncbi:unnamed protein product [Paramecium sonneborni]|uniref:Uncharacterized protein n=1 Tax=Paramecium sonneborni TaxID=65129 RepID=A0A8S1KR94_9CILI|nr:unnamed protein product [Paramecium sonneborni]
MIQLNLRNKLILEEELIDKNNQIQQFTKIQDEIKSLKDLYFKMLSK